MSATSRTQPQAASDLVRFTRWSKEQARLDSNFFKASLAAAEARIDTLEAELQSVSRQISLRSPEGF